MEQATSVAEDSSSYTVHTGETRKHIFLGNKYSFTYMRNLQENLIFHETTSISFLQM